MTNDMLNKLGAIDVMPSERLIFSSASTHKGRIEYRQRSFESECFDNKSMELTDWDAGCLPTLFPLLLKKEGMKAGDFLYTRIPANDITRLQDATQAGFYYIETTLIPYMNLRNWNREAHRRSICTLELVDDTTLFEVEEIAESTFRGLRFNIDPNIGDDAADRRYHRWLINAYERGEELLILRHRGRAAGFSVLRRIDKDNAVFVLTGVHPDYKGSGVGLMLNASTVAYCQDTGIKHIDGGISADNTAILNVNARVGFSFRDTSIVMHYYVK